MDHSDYRNNVNIIEILDDDEEEYNPNNNWKLFGRNAEEVATDYESMASHITNTNSVYDDDMISLSSSRFESSIANSCQSEFAPPPPKVQSWLNIKSEPEWSGSEDGGEVTFSNYMKSQNKERQSESINPVAYRNALSKYRRAVRIVEKFENMNPHFLSNIDLDELEVARQTVNDKELLSYLENGDCLPIENETDIIDLTINENGGGVGPSRNFDDGFLIPNTNNIPSLRMNIKKRRESSEILSNRNFNTTEFSRIVILNNQDRHGRLTQEQWQQIEEKIQEAVLAYYKTGYDKSELLFDRAGWMRGNKVITCGNQRSARFLRNFINGIGEIWDGARIQAISLDDMEKYRNAPKVWVFIPKPYTTPEKVLSLLSSQNKGLKAESWRVIKQAARKDRGQDYLLAIDKKSIPFLEKRQYRINYSIAKVRVRPVKGSLQNGIKSNTSSRLDVNSSTNENVHNSQQPPNNDLGINSSIFTF